MKKLIPLALALVLLASPAQAFSVKTPFVKTGHALKVAGKHVGRVALYGVIVLAVIEVCGHGGCN